MKSIERVERAMFGRLQRHGNPNYGYRRGVVFHLLGRMDVVRSLRASRRWRCKILIERGSRLSVVGEGRLIASRGSVLLIGFEPELRSASAVVVGDGGTLTIGGTVSILRGAMVNIGPTGHLEIADGLVLNEGGRIMCRERIAFGADCLVGYGSTISDSDEHEVIAQRDSLGRTYRDQSHVVASVQIEDHVWIGAQAIVLKGVTIGAHAVVGAGSVVTHPVGSGELVAGTPARVLRRDISWLP